MPFQVKPSKEIEKPKEKESFKPVFPGDPSLKAEVKPVVKPVEVKPVVKPVVIMSYILRDPDGWKNEDIT